MKLPFFHCLMHYFAGNLTSYINNTFLSEKRISCKFMRLRKFLYSQVQGI